MIRQAMMMVSGLRRMSHRLMNRKMNKRNCNYLGMSTMVLAMQVLRVFCGTCALNFRIGLLVMCIILTNPFRTCAWGEANFLLTCTNIQRQCGLASHFRIPSAGNPQVSETP